MRFHFTSKDRFKSAAKKLSHALAGLKLSQAQEAIAKATGYSNWHELERTTSPETGSEFDRALDPADFRKRAVDRISLISSLTGHSPGDVQFALSRCRLTNDRAWSFDDQVALRFAAWRTNGQLRLGPRVPGSIVRATGVGKPKLGYLCKFHGAPRVLTDRGFADRASFEIVVPRKLQTDFLPMRLWLPYGYWTLADGSKVVFSRDYFPMWHLTSKGVTRLPPWLWVEGIKETFHFAGGHASEWYYPEVRGEVVAWMTEVGIEGLPKLADALPELTKFGVRDLGIALAVMRAGSQAPDPKGPWHLESSYAQIKLDYN